MQAKLIDKILTCSILSEPLQEGVWSDTGKSVLIPERLLFELYQKEVLHRPNVDDAYIVEELTKKFNSNLQRMDYGAMLERERQQKRSSLTDETTA